MQPARSAKRRIPFGDVAVRRFRIDPADAIAVEFRIPDHPIDQREIEAIGRDPVRLPLATGLHLIGLEQFVFFALQRLWMKAENGIPARIGVPDDAFGIFRVNA